MTLSEELRIRLLATQPSLHAWVTGCPVVKK